MKSLLIPRIKSPAIFKTYPFELIRSSASWFASTVKMGLQEIVCVDRWDFDVISVFSPNPNRTYGFHHIRLSIGNILLRLESFAPLELPNFITTITPPTRRLKYVAIPTESFFVSHVPLNLSLICFRCTLFYNDPFLLVFHNGDRLLHQNRYSFEDVRVPHHDKSTSALHRTRLHWASDTFSRIYQSED